MMEVWAVFVVLFVISFGAAGFVYWRGKKRLDNQEKNGSPAPVPRGELREMGNDVDEITEAAKRMKSRIKALESLAEERARGRG